jgi:hypothetical protein
MTDCGHEHEDGAYVLGALSPEDRIAFERHLPGCPECARSVRELAGLPGLLARVPVEIVDPDAAPRTPVPDTLLPALVRRARSSRNRRRWIAGGLAAAAVAAGVVVVTTVAGGDHAPPSAGPSASATTATAEPFKPVGAEPISGWISLTPVGWGTRLDLVCSYADEHGYGDTSGTTYLMYVVHADGSTEQVASWKALPGKTMRLSAATAATVRDIADVEVRTASGRTVLELS